jgi:type IV pilus assembly protein PilM
MSLGSDILDRMESWTPAWLPTLRPPYPPVAIEIDGRDAVLVRLKKHRRGKPDLEAHQIRPMPDDVGDLSIFSRSMGAQSEMTAKVRELFETTGTKPGRVSLVLPDNLAKISLLHLPERPASRRQLDEIVRFKLRRGVPFRLDEAVLTYQILPGEGRGVTVLVALIRHAAVEQFERMVMAAGARPGLVDLCSTNLMNLVRPAVDEVCTRGDDVGLLNCGHRYFTLLIVRANRLIFFRCKSLGVDTVQATGHLSREISNSLAYYREKLEGKGLGAVLVRSVGAPLEQVIETVARLEVGDVRAVDPARSLNIPAGLRMDPALGQRLAPAVAAAAGRGR